MPNDVLTAAIDTLAERRDLTQEQAGGVLAEIMAGNCADAQVAAFLIALRTKGETVEEIAGLAATMRAMATPVPTVRERLLDTAGTGGGRHTFNVSTTAALVAAGARRAGAQHGNPRATRAAGSAARLAGLGGRGDPPPAAL